MTQPVKRPEPSAEPKKPAQEELPSSPLATQHESQGGFLKKSSFSTWQKVLIFCTFGLAAYFIRKKGEKK